MRCPGMTLGKMPLFVWMILVDGGLDADRDAAAHRGADHAARSTASSARTSSTRRPAARPCSGSTSSGSSATPRSTSSILPGVRVRLRDHPGLLAQGRSSATRSWSRPSVAIGFISLGVWAHHMFTVGMTPARATRSSPSRRCSSPCRPASRSSTGSATMWGGKIRFATPMLFCIGVPLPVPVRRADRHHARASRRSTGSSRDSYFVVAHFHYVLDRRRSSSPSSPRSTTGSRRRPAGCSSERLGRWHFWLFVIGFNLTFAPLHFAGHARHAAAHLHLRAPAAAGRSGTCCRRVGVVVPGGGDPDLPLERRALARAAGAPAGDDPWDAWTLEWATTSPPPAYNFATLAGRAQPPAALGPQASGRSRTGSTNERRRRTAAPRRRALDAARPRARRHGRA